MTETSTPDAGQTSDPPQYPVLAAPADGVPDIVEDERRLIAAAQAIAAGTGPVALDAERASGYRYGGRAYLVQIRREGAGSWLIDPIACPDLGPVQDAIGEAEWVLHAATQDLACLAEVGLSPTRLFDTELGSRLAGLPRVGLAAVVEHYLGITLAKEHSAVDWSTRPLPEPWLTYAALDVEVLVQVRDLVRADLERQGKLPWALEEFDALTSFTGPPVRTDPWRRTSGMHRVRDRRAVARIRELWQTRDDIARQRDISPGRVLPDALLVEMAVKAPTTPDGLTAALADASAGTSRRGRARPPHRSVARYQREWLAAIRRVTTLPDSELPPTTVRSDAPPPPRAWADRDPVAAARLQQVREQLTAYGEEHHVPVENLLTPDYLRRVLWSPPQPLDEASLQGALATLGARPWQRDIAVPLILRAVADHPNTDQ
ncbi:HRDC domain-containing protein [Luteipulveratus sp. YIM 133132]|uniref:HRDC domain-containing protein n=1 Tax=Luteipulveratus flavus TaxID=3031728 RepID=UPI0023AF229E|nr:HRDC domain-containing protein [Luteipulveratus sp. YIM 133132]MDE9366824.1 HRDC domain-containing protein [Luteipulveratus sp. YIM 133132]